ncbi:MAG: ROK family glucokinase [Clostridia bacterium]|nr:ROK family glucokinase [Oscillospiraceae bacterium]MBQ2748842.1 ROK family glucokinase [Clostridia bacterium]
MYYIGIDLGGTNIAVGLVNEEMKLVATKSTPTLTNRDINDIIKDMAETTLALIAEQGLTEADVAAIGIGSPGTVDGKNGVIIYSCNIPFNHTNIREAFKAYTSIPVYCGNDADVAALGEAYAGAAAGCDHAIMITLGTGVGGGVIINKHIVAGFNGAGGELGHMVIEKDGAQCNCGRKGCWEAYSSATGLIRMTKEAMEKNKDSLMWKLAPTLDEVDGKTSFDAMKQGDEAAKQVVDTYCDYLACGLLNIINIFQPEVLCLGGGVAKQGQFLIDMLMPRIEKERYSKDIPQTTIKPAILGNDAGIIGAAMLGK